MEEDRRPARKPDHPHPDQGQFLGDGRRRPVRTLFGDLLRPWRSYPRRPAGSPDEDGDRFTEIWNLVFMQYEQEANEIVGELPKQSIDTGMGLERIAAVMQGVHDNYDTDTVQGADRRERGADPHQGRRRAEGEPPRDRRPSARLAASWSPTACCRPTRAGAMSCAGSCAGRCATRICSAPRSR